MEAYYRAGQRVSRRNTSIREQLWCARGKRGDLSDKGEKEDKTVKICSRVGCGVKILERDEDIN